MSTSLVTAAATLPAVNNQECPRVLHVITGTHVGGAEMMLWKLLAADAEQAAAAAVLALQPDGPIAERIRALGVKVESLQMRAALSFAWAGLGLRQAVIRQRPAVLLGWMYHGALAAQLAAALTGRAGPKVVWAIRQSLATYDEEKFSTRTVVRILAALSALPDGIVYNSRRGARDHQHLGFAAGKAILIPNGFDTETFRPNPQARGWLRQHLRLPMDTELVGITARYDPMKGYREFAAAAGRARQQRPKLQFVLTGKGVTAENGELQRYLRQAGVEKYSHCLGMRSEVAGIMAGLDVATSASTMKEGFSNSIGEAMACGLPCVVTDVGDAAWIVGDTGTVVPPGNSEALAAAWLDHLGRDPDARRVAGERARRRVEQEFSMPAICARFRAALRAAVGGTRPEAALP